jgi:hypothetical protein
MRALFLLVLAVVVIVGGLKLAGVPVPLLDYPIGPIGVEGRGPGMPDIEVRPPGFGDTDQLP